MNGRARQRREHESAVWVIFCSCRIVLRSVLVIMAGVAVAKLGAWMVLRMAV